MRYRPPKGFGPKGQKPFIHLEDILGGFGGPRRPQPYSPPSIEDLAPGAGRAPAPGPFKGLPVRPGRMPFHGPGGPGAGGPVMPGRPPQGGIMPPQHAPLMPEEEEQGFGPMQGQYGEMDPVMAMILQRAMARYRRF